MIFLLIYEKMKYPLNIKNKKTNLILFLNKFSDDCFIFSSIIQGVLYKKGGSNSFIIFSKYLFFIIFILKK